MNLGETPSKKRKLTEKGDEGGESGTEQSDLPTSSKSLQSPSNNFPESDGSSAQQKSYIDHDLIHMLMGTIDSLCRSIAAPTADDDTVMDEEEPSVELQQQQSPLKPETSTPQTPSGTSTESKSSPTNKE